MKSKDKKTLISKYTDLKLELVKIIENSDYEIDVDGDIVDQLQGQHLINIQNKLSMKNLNKLKAINIALDLISKDEYGDCCECGESIDIKRLIAIPGATFCVRCAELSEIRR
jgi:DnaK suppressor protein